MTVEGTEPRLLGGRYQLNEPIGYGGMAEVFRGRDVRLDRDVAVKILRADLARDPSFQARFRREAQAAASLNHPNIVSVYDTGDDGIGTGGETGTPYIVMEYVEGRTLREVLLEDHRLLPRRAMEIVNDVCAALEYSHVAGIVHRDIKPGNVMLTRSGVVKVMDFGIARAITASAATMTQTAAVIGTAQYLSPEQARGEHVDARSDIYSAGCLLYELITGVAPFRGDSAVAIAYQHVREDPVPPSAVDPELPPAVDAVVLKAMAKNPANRYQSAAEFGADLERAAAGRRVVATPVLTPAAAAAAPATSVLLRPDAQPDRRTRRALAYLLLFVAVIAVFVGAALLVRNLVSGGGSAGDIAMPNLIGLSQAQAQARLEDVGLHLGDPKHVFEKTNDHKGQVIAQAFAARVQVPKGTSVDVTISDGIQLVQVPAVKGLSVADATKALQDRNLKVAITMRDTGDPAGQVIDVMPSEGKSVDAGTTVTLVVASGKIAVPDVTGQGADAAAAILTKAGFQVGRSSEPSDRPAGTVIRTDPAAGATLDPNATVTIIVAVPQPPPPTTPPPTTPPTPPPTTPPPSPSESASP